MDALRLLQRAFDLLRYGNHLSARSAAILRALRDAMLLALGPEPPRRRAEIAALLREWQGMGVGAYQDIGQLTVELDRLASLYRVQAGVDVGRVVAERPVDPEIVGLRVDRWVSEQLHRLNFRVEAQLRLGVTRGEDSAQIAERVRRVIGQRERETATLLRTAAVRVATAGYEDGLRAAGVDRYRYVAVMDTRTTREGGWHDVGCWGANDVVFRFDDPEAPRPGWHWNCRSHIEPVTEAEPAEPQGFGAEALRRAGFNVEDVRAAERQVLAEGGATVASAPRDWRAIIRNQPVGTRVAVLGSAGARRIGLGLSLATTAQRETSQLTLEELRARL